VSALWSKFQSMLCVVQEQTSSGDVNTASSVADSNVDVHTAASSVAAVAEAALHQFSPQLTTKILELLCDESVSY